jgi:uncharacterized protein YdiU (UPF0061 family)
MQTTISAAPLEKLAFDNTFISELPGDPLTENNRRQVRGACYSLVKPTPVSAPRLAGFSQDSADLLDLSSEACRSAEFTSVFSGNVLLANMEPYAMCYGGHQFGNWAGQLGDGRAINLGEIINSKSERWALQLKGAGPTPYSRSADGLAVLRSSLREFICSEAMHHLGIPSTRALSLVLTGDEVVRDMFYDGHPKNEPGAVVCRLSPSFIRFGNFEILTARGETELLEKLVLHTIQTDFPELTATPSVDNYLQWFTEICRRTAQMINHWMRVGFVHGVMNTDNMSILGLTIDYGPYGWLEGYDPTWTPNTTDAQGRRYSYGNQPYMAQWNLTQLANALYPLIGETQPLKEALDVYGTTFQESWQITMAAKIGLKNREPEDGQLINNLLELLTKTETDMTIFFRRLALVNARTTQDDAIEILHEAYYKPEELNSSYRSEISGWLVAYRSRLAQDNADDRQRLERMNRVNPKYVFRNYLAQQAIDKAEQGDFSMIDELLALFRHPYDEQPEKETYAAKRPEWARNRAGCSMLSCSS